MHEGRYTGSAFCACIRVKSKRIGKWWHHAAHDFGRSVKIYALTKILNVVKEVKVSVQTITASHTPPTERAAHNWADR